MCSDNFKKDSFLLKLLYQYMYFCMQDLATTEAEAAVAALVQLNFCFKEERVFIL